MSIDKFNKWTNWIGIIADEVTRLSIKRHIFRETQKIIANNEKIHKPSVFYSFIGTSYRDSSVMAVRRQIKNDNDSISFAKLLREITEEPQVVSRQRFVSMYTNVPHLANSDLDQFSKEGGDHIDPDMVRQDLDNLRDLSSKLEDLADRRIAHYDKRPPPRNFRHLMSWTTA